MRCNHHPYDFDRTCAECVALKSSLSLNRIYADIEDARIRAQMEPLREKWGKRDMARDGGPLNLAEMVQDIDRWVRGDVS